MVLVDSLLLEIRALLQRGSQILVSLSCGSIARGLYGEEVDILVLGTVELAVDEIEVHVVVHLAISLTLVGGGCTGVIGDSILANGCSCGAASAQASQPKLALLRVGVRVFRLLLVHQIGFELVVEVIIPILSIFNGTHV